MNNLLVTGGAGFIGANFVHYWLRRHEDGAVVVLDALTYAGNRLSLAQMEGHPRFSFVHGDIRDAVLIEKLMLEHSIDVIVHFAAESHVDRSITRPDAFIDTNIIGTHTLLKTARKIWVEKGVPGRPVRFHNVSTDEVYGSLEPEDAPFRESTPYAPNSPYSASKASADHLTRAYGHTFGLPVTTSNCSNNYGPYQFPEKLIPLMITSALDGDQLPVYGDGMNVRDWLYVEDHCRGIERVLECGKVGETYNIGGNNEQRNIDIVRHICALVDAAFARDPSWAERFPNCPAAGNSRCDELIHFVKDRPGHDRRYAIDAARMEKELGFRPEMTFARGIGETIEWYLKNEGWWRPLLHR